MPKPLTADQIEQGVRDAYAAGEDPTDIGRRYRLSADDVVRVAEGAPVEVERGRRRRWKRLDLAIVIGLLLGIFANLLGASSAAQVVVWVLGAVVAYALLSRR